VTEPAPITIEADTRKSIAEMGVLHGAQHALAASALDVAREIDAGQKTPDRYRELRMTMRDLWDLRHFGVGEVPAGDAPPEPPAEVDPIDQVAEQRRKRLEEGQAG
jgi:hypothetical protein